MVDRLCLPASFILKTSQRIYAKFGIGGEFKIKIEFYVCIRKTCISS
jgi:hypothetical protein